MEPDEIKVTVNEQGEPSPITSQLVACVYVTISPRLVLDESKTDETVQKVTEFAAAQFRRMLEKAQQDPDWHWRKKITE